MTLLNESDSVVKLDRMRYTKDSLSGNLLLLAIVFDALYFVVLYQQDVSNYFYTWEIGVSVVYNLVFLLATFLCSESVKSRKTELVWLIVVLGLMQFVRITQIPARAVKAVVMVGETSYDVMDNGTYMFLVTMLVLSGVCMLVSAVTATLNTRRLNEYKKTMDNQSA